MHSFGGRTEFDEKFKNEVRPQFPTDEYWTAKLEHAYEHAVKFVFDIDPQNARLEELKEQVTTDSRLAHEARKQQEGEDDEESKSASSDEDGAQPKQDADWQKPEEQTDGSNEPEGAFSSMGCKLNPDDFRRPAANEEAGPGEVKAEEDEKK